MKKRSVKRWIILCFTGIFIFSLTISALANFRENYRAVVRRSDEDMDRCALMVNKELTDKDLTALLSPENKAEYDKIRSSLLYSTGVFEADSLLVYTINPETRRRHVYFALAPVPEKDRMYQETMPPGADLEEPLLPAEEKWLAGDKEIIDSYRDGYQTFRFHGCPGENGGPDYIISMENNVQLERQQLLSDCLWDLIPIVLSLLTGLLILLFLVRKRIIRPIAMISDSMSRFAHDSSQNPEPLKLETPDEIGQIAASYNRMTADISSYVGSIENLNREKTEAKVQLDIARRIQYGLVPEKMTLQGSGFRACAVTRPAKEVGGDFYDCFLRDEHSVCAVMGDVSGKGVTAAIFMAMAKTMIREKLLAGLTPAQALNQANDELCGQNPEGLFTTVFAAVLNPRTGELCYANAGHTHPVLLTETPSFLCPEPGIVMGIFRDVKLKDYTLTLCPDEGILLYTDGVTESLSPERKFFGDQRLLDTVQAIADRTDAEKTVSAVFKAAEDFTGGGEPFDDTAALALLRTPAEGDSAAGPVKVRRFAENDRISLPVDLSAFDTIRRTVTEAAGSSRATRMALLACDETLANIVNYSGATELSFSCEKQDNVLHISFLDNGAPFDPTAVGAEKAFEQLDSGGMGLKLIRQNAAGMRYERRQNRNELSLYFNL